MKLPPQTHAAWRDMRIEATKMVIGSEEKGSVLFLMNPILGHVTVYIRGLIFENLLKQNGWRVSFVDINQFEESKIVEMASHFDIVYLLKVASLELVEKIKSSTRSQIIFDLTDALWKPYHRQYGWGNLEKILMLVDVIFSENEYICSYGRRFCSRVYSIPACTQVERFDMMRDQVPERNDGKIRIGWVGSMGTVTAIDKIKQPLIYLFEHYSNLELRLLGCDTNPLSDILTANVSIVPQYDEDRMIWEFLQMDIGVYPPPLDLEDYAVRGALKGMLYMTAGIPTVCQNAGDCVNIIQDNINGMLANTEEEWRQKLETLILSPDLRWEMGQRAQSSIRQEHSLIQVFNYLQEALLDVIRTSQLKFEHISSKRPIGEDYPQSKFLVSEGQFDELFYLGQYPDVAAAIRTGQFRSAWEHYDLYGRSENRIAKSLDIGVIIRPLGETLSTLDSESVLQLPLKSIPEVNDHQEIQEINRRKNLTTETLDLLLKADDLPAAIDRYRNRFDDELLNLVRQNIAAALRDGNVALADGLCNLVDVIENLE